MSDAGYQDEEEFQGSWNGRTLLRILTLLRPHKAMSIGFISAVAVMAMLEAFQTRLISMVIDEGLEARNPQRLTELLTFYGGLMIVFSALVFTFIYLTGRLGQQVQYDLRKKIFEHLQTLSIAYYNKTPVGWIMSRVTSDSERIGDLISWGFLDITWGTMNILAGLFFMASINIQLTLVVVPLVPILLGIATWFQARILVGYREARKANSKITGNYNEMITGARVIKALNREESSMKEFGVLTRDMYRSSYDAAWYSALFMPSIMIASSVAVGAVAFFGGRQVETVVPGGMSVGEIQAFIAYITFMMWPVMEMARVFASMQHAIASAERSFSLLDTKADLVNRPGSKDPGTIHGDIVFDDVTFYYEENKPILTNFNLHVKAGEMVALVGETGGGKSTIVNLVCRFYEPRSGVITFNGVDYMDLTMEGIHSRIGVVLQTPHLFGGTIRDNIRYGRLNATDEEVESAATTAGTDEFIRAFEKGYDEEVGEGGVLLSTGQKQLISLARAVLARPELLVMDEATSSVDTLTEAMIQKGMENVLKGRTSFVIAHRLSTIRSADRIVVIEGGKIIEQGNHRELLRKKGYYHNLYTKQFRQEKEAIIDKTLTGEMSVVTANGTPASTTETELIGK